MQSTHHKIFKKIVLCAVLLLGSLAHLVSIPSTEFTHLIWLKSLETMTLGDLNMKPFTYQDLPFTAMVQDVLRHAPAHEL